jgi:hypothetical protein
MVQSLKDALTKFNFNFENLIRVLEFLSFSLQCHRRTVQEGDGLRTDLHLDHFVDGEAVFVVPDKDAHQNINANVKI